MSEIDVSMIELAEKFNNSLSMCNSEDIPTLKNRIDELLTNSNEKILKIFIRTLLSVIPARYMSLRKLAELISIIQISSNDNFKNVFLKEIEKRTKEPNNEILCAFLSNLVHVGYITADYLMDLLLRDFESAHKLGNDVFMQIIILVVSCCTELHQANEEKLGQIFEAIDSRKHVISSGLFQDENAPVFEDFYNYLEEIKNNAWVIPDDFPLKKIIDAIKEDNDGALRNELVGEIDANYQINPSVLLAPPILGFSAPLVSLCAFFGAKNCVEMLINQGCDLSIEDDEGRNVMQFAIASGNMEIIRIIDSHDIPIDGCFSVAIEYMQKDAFNFLLEKQSDLSYGIEETIDCPLHAAAKTNSVYFAKLLLSHGVSRLSRDEYNWTPLHIAASYNSIEVLKLLLEHKNNESVNPNVADLDGDTPLHCAAKEGFIDCIEVLLEQPGINANARDRHGATPLHYAACYDKADAVQYLLNTNVVDPNMTDEFHRSALQMSAVSGSCSAAHVLASDQRIDPNTIDMDHVTPLLAAISYGELDLVKEICSARNINLNIKNKENVAPIEVAAFNDKPEIVQYLASLGADRSGLVQAMGQLSEAMQRVVSNL